MFEISTAIILLLIIIIVLVKYKSFWTKQHEELAKHFDGEIAKDGNSVTLQYKGKDFIVSRMAGGGHGSYGVLELLVEANNNFTISKNYLNKIEVSGKQPTQEDLSKLINENKTLEAKIKKSLSKTNATIEGGSKINVSSKKMFTKINTLGIYGLSTPYLKLPATLESEMDLLIEINNLFS